MDHGWIEVTEPAALADVLDTDVGVGADELYSALMQIPGSELWWITQTEIVRPTDGAGLGLQLLKTRVFFNVTEARKVWGDVAVAATVFLLTTNLPVAGAVALVKKLIDNLKLLDEEEAEAVKVIMGLAGRQPYDKSVAEASIRAAYQDATVDIDKVLDRLEGKKLLRSERGDTVRLVV